MDAARRDRGAHRRAVLLALSASLLGLAGCCAAGRRASFRPHEETAAGAPQSPEKTPHAARPVEETSKLAPVLHAEVQRWREKPLVVVRTEVPSPNWRAALVPVATTEEATREYRLVLVPPDEGSMSTDPPDGTSATPTELTVLSSEDFGEAVEQVVLYGRDDVLVVPTR